MTPIVSEEMREKAREIMLDGAVRSRELIRELIAQALQEAHDKGVLEEREECAKVAEGVKSHSVELRSDHTLHCYDKDVSTTIRNRGKQEETR